MSQTLIGVRREDKSKWERRVPFTPKAVAEFKAMGVPFFVQTSPIRVFKDEEYIEAGAEVGEDLTRADMIFAVKEIPKEMIEENKTYIFFSHTIKGQSYNMPLLRKLIDSKATLVDYERIVDDQGRRLVFFGAHAGYAGMIDSLNLLGQKHAGQGKQCRFQNVKMAHEYSSLDEAKREIHSLSDSILSEGFNDPVVFGFAGYGNVSRGAQEILDTLPIEEISPVELLTLRETTSAPYRCVYKVVFKEEDMAERIDGSAFELQTYYDHPELFHSKFAQYVPLINVLINAIYWTEKYPRLVTKTMIQEIWKDGGRRPEVIGDISIDIDGAIELSYKATYSDQPSFVYEPGADRFIDGIEGDGPLVLAVDNLPCELPRESSENFSRALKSFVLQMAQANWDVPFEDLDVPAPIKSAVIVHRGSLTSDYTYLNQFLNS